jgi:hypothetical protein
MTRSALETLTTHLRNAGWNQPTSDPNQDGVYRSMCGAYTHPDNNHTIHIAPIGEIQVNRRYPNGATRRILILAFDSPLLPIAVLRLLDVIPGSDTSTAVEPKLISDKTIDLGSGQEEPCVAKT